MPYQIIKTKRDNEYIYRLTDVRDGRILHVATSRDPAKAPEPMRRYQARLNTAFAFGG